MSGAPCGCEFHAAHSGCSTSCRAIGCGVAAKWVDLFGAAPDWTGGMDVDEYLAEQRGEA